MKYESQDKDQRFISELGKRWGNQTATANLCGVSKQAINKMYQKAQKAQKSGQPDALPDRLKCLLDEALIASTNRIDDPNFTEILFAPKIIWGFVCYYAHHAGRYCTDQAKKSVENIGELGIDVFIGRMAGDPVAIGDAGMQAIAELRTQLAVMQQNLAESEERETFWENLSYEAFKQTDAAIASSEQITQELLEAIEEKEDILAHVAAAFEYGTTSTAKLAQRRYDELTAETDEQSEEQEQEF